MDNECYTINQYKDDKKQILEQVCFPEIFFFFKIVLARIIAAITSAGSNTEYFEKKEACRVSWKKSFITP